MKDVKGTTVKRWAEGVTELLCAAEISHAKVAEKIDLPRSNVTRWLNGAVTPTPVNVRAVNKALAVLTQDPDAEPYLAVLAMLDGIDIAAMSVMDVDVRDVGSSSLGRLVFAAAKLVAQFANFFEGDIHRALADLIRRDPATAIGLCSGLTMVRGQQILARLEGAATKRPYFDTVAMLFDKAGLSSLIKHDAATDLLRARERVRLEIDRILSTVSVPTSERVPLARKLQVLTDGIFSAILSSHGHSSDYLATIAKELSRTKK